MRNTKQATLIGFSAIVLWSAIIGFIKEVTHAFGPVGGSALMYSVAFLFLLPSVGWVSLKKFSRTYLLWGGVLMVAYEVCLALSIGYSESNRQAIEIGMVNYLWPTFTLVATVVFHTHKVHWLIVPGILCSALGIGWVLGGEEGLNFNQLVRNVQSNPLSYGLAFLGALLWSAYCVVTVKYARGVNGVTLFFLGVALVLWAKYLLLGESVVMQVNLSSIVYLVIAAGAMGFGYAAWNVGIMSGNVTLLTVASYFIPVLSSAFSSVLLSAPLALSFWQGAFLVCMGSLLCWLSTRRA
jgi:drug/metabolite transporter (DMT)-like permease